jgi:hypothetical protein
MASVLESSGEDGSITGAVFPTEGRLFITCDEKMESQGQQHPVPCERDAGATEDREERRDGLIPALAPSWHAEIDAFLTCCRGLSPERSLTFSSATGFLPNGPSVR